MSASPLWRAVHAPGGQQADVAQALLSRGANPEDGLSWGVFGSMGTATPLSAAAAARDARSVKALLAAGASPNAGLTLGPFGLFGVRTPLECAIGATVTDGAVPDAAVAECAKLLLDAGADPNVGDHNLGMIGTFLPWVPRQRVLFTAAASGDASVVQQLLRNGADPEAGAGWGPFGWWSHMTPLGVAAERGNADAAQALIRGGARLHSGSRLGLPVAPIMTGTPLAEAARKGHARVVTTLLDNGARPSKGFDVMGGLLGHATPLSWALHGRHSDVAEALLAAHLATQHARDDETDSEVFEGGLNSS